ncbi:hypothetical protein LJB99_04320 [Deltaproteobacteria bacterium OttesenSCG-928-K17]|nr:hypothetical protein [Deltaproteobacteria bacterium OttesenSCG-928-K17]
MPAAAKTAPCQGLKPFNNLDELLYQFYINLESDCLFETPVEELEEAWGTKIFNGRNMLAPENVRLENSSEFRGKPYLTEKDSFYIAIAPLKGNKRTFEIRITTEYAGRHNSLLPPNVFPRLLPEPRKSNMLILPGRHFETAFGSKTTPCSPTFFWQSSDGSRLIYYCRAYGLTVITITA